MSVVVVVVIVVFEEESVLPEVVEGDVVVHATNDAVKMATKKRIFFIN